MKVYRFLRWYDHPNNLSMGSFNEINNFNDFGLISPSYSYLWPCYTRQKKNNSFDLEKEMVKFFFASLDDLFFVLSYIKSEFNTIIEVDLPEEILRKYLGIGIYGMCERVNIEFRIPYKVLYTHLAKQPTDYFYKAIRYYNRNINRFYLDTKWGYKKIEKLLSEVPFHDIHQIGRLSIYPLFCFEPTSIFSFKQEEIGLSRIFEILDTIEETRAKRHITSRIKTLKDNWNNEVIFDKNYPLIARENEEIKRILTKK